MDVTQLSAEVGRLQIAPAPDHECGVATAVLHTGDDAVVRHFVGTTAMRTIVCTVDCDVRDNFDAAGFFLETYEACVTFWAGAMVCSWAVRGGEFAFGGPAMVQCGAWKDFENVDQLKNARNGLMVHLGMEPES
jgi:hypothetical protein